MSKHLDLGQGSFQSLNRGEVGLQRLASLGAFGMGKVHGMVEVSLRSVKLPLKLEVGRERAAHINLGCRVGRVECIKGGPELVRCVAAEASDQELRVLALHSPVHSDNLSLGEAEQPEGLGDVGTEVRELAWRVLSLARHVVEHAAGPAEQLVGFLLGGIKLLACSNTTETSEKTEREKD